MPPKAAKDIDELRGLLAEVKVLRDDIETKGAELRAEWGDAADKSPPRALNLSHYIALRDHDLTDLQYRLAARGLSSLGRSEARVAPALDALIATLRRLTGDTSAPYPPLSSGARALPNSRPKPTACSASDPRARRACGSWRRCQRRRRRSPNSSTAWWSPAWTAHASIAPMTTPRHGGKWSPMCAKPRAASSARAKF